MPIIRDIINGAVMRGGSLRGICDRAGLTPFELNDSDAKVPFDQAYRVWEVCMEATNDPFLGLYLGQRASPVVVGMVGLLMQSSATLARAFAQVVEYNKMFTNIFTYSINHRKEWSVLTFEPIPLWKKTSLETAQQAVDHAMAGTKNVFEILSGQKLTPTRVELCRKRPRGSDVYDMAFQCAVQFNAKSNQLTFSEEAMMTPVLSYDQSLFKTLQDLAKKKAARPGSDLIRKMYNLALTQFNGQVPSIEMMAAQFSLTSRSLQRRLAEEHLTYRALTAQWQREFADHLLKSHDNKISEVARLLGYSEARAFRRAYKKWTNVVPSKRRR